MRSDSDIDIAYLSDKKLSEYEVFSISQELAGLIGIGIGIGIDLIDLSKASSVFKTNILGSSKIIYSADEKKSMSFR